MTVADELLTTAEDLILMRASALRAQADRLTVELDRLRPIVDAAEYVIGPPGCADEDRDCDEYVDEAGIPLDDVGWCSHVTVVHAMYAHVAAHDLLVSLVGEVRAMLLDLPGAEPVLDVLRDGLTSIVSDVDSPPDGLFDGPAYQMALVEEEDARANARAERGTNRG